MELSKIRLIRLFDDDGDGVIKVRFSAESNLDKTSAEIYTGADKLAEFGNQLQKFPVNLREVVYECGQDIANSFGYLFLRAYLYDTLGHAGLEVKTRRNGAQFLQAQSHFSLTTEVASINSLGKYLAEWSGSHEREFEFDLYSGLH